MAYVLGLWWADGNIYRDKRCARGGSVSFSSADFEHLESVNKLIGGKYRVKKRRGENTYDLVISRYEAYLDIKAKGGEEAKSLTCKFPDVPAKFIREFCRGVVDGDGSLFWNSVRNKSGVSTSPVLAVCGTVDFLSKFSSQVEIHSGIPSSKAYVAKDKIPFIRYSGLRAKCLSFWLYQNSEGACLQRKKHLAHDFCAWHPKKKGFKKSQITNEMEKKYAQILYS